MQARASSQHVVSRQFGRLLVQEGRPNGQGPFLVEDLTTIVGERDEPPARLFEG
jgi:hypothetical protein